MGGGGFGRGPGGVGHLREGAARIGTKQKVFHRSYAVR
jgi:hypothetical protein